MIDKASLIQIPSGYKNGKLYSVKPTPTYGSELVVNGDFSNGSTGWSDFGTPTTSEQSTDRAYLGSYSWYVLASVFRQGIFSLNNFSLVNGKTYKVSFWVYAVDGNEILSGVTNSDATVFTSRVVTQGEWSNVVYYITANANSASYISLLSSSSTLEFYVDNVSVKEITNIGDFTFSRSSSATRVNSEGLIEEMSTNVPRLDYSDASCASLLLEGQSTNLVTYSEDFRSNSNFSTNAPNSIFESGYLAPDGSLTATRINSFDGYYVALSNLGSGDARSMYVKSGNGQNGNVNLLDNNSHTHSLFEVTNEWKRVELVGNDTWFYIVDGRGGSLTLDDVIVWGLQQEDLSYATSYIPTSGSTVTRTADVCNNAGTSATFNSTEGVLFAEILKKQDNNDNFILISLNNDASNSAANSVTIGFDNSDKFFFRVKSPSGSYTSQTILSNENQFYKVALKYKSGDIAIWIDGVEVATSTVSFLFAQTLDNLSFDYNGNGTLPFYGKCKQLIVFNEALSDSELQALTS